MLDGFNPMQPSYSWKSPIPTKTLALPNAGGQTCRLDLVVTGTVGKAGPAAPMTIHLSLEDSILSPGKMQVDKNEQRGYFQDEIVIEMFLSTDGTTERTDFQRVSDGPQTVNGSGSTSSSVSVSFSVSANANAGFFGGTATGGGGVGASLGMTNSHSFSKNLSDFKVINDTGAHRIIHTYRMAETTGGKYEKANDLVPKGADIDLFEAFQPIKLYRPPDLATSNLPLISQAVWQATSSKEYDESLYCFLTVTQRLVKVTGRNDFVSVHSQSTGTKVTHYHHEAIQLKPFNVDGGGDQKQL